MTAAVYAKGTRVPVSRSREEVEYDLKRFGATAFAYMEDGPRSIVQFRMSDRVIRLEIVLPTDKQEQRERWRSVVIYVKARLAAVQAKITTLEDAFMPDIVLPDGGRIGSWLRPQIALAYENGEPPKMLPAPDADRSMKGAA